MPLKISKFLPKDEFHINCQSLVQDPSYDRVPSSTHMSIRSHERIYPSEPPFPQDTQHKAFAAKTNDSRSDGRNLPIYGSKPTSQRREFSNNECLITNQAQNLVV